MGSGIKGFVHLCSFSGDAVDLKTKERTSLNVLRALNDNPRISTWDFSENRWLDIIVSDLEKEGLIKPVKSEFPWHKYELTENGKNMLATIAVSFLPT